MEESLYENSCVVCKREQSDKRIVEVENEILTVITLCEDCFERRIQPMFDENAENIQEVVKWFKDRRLIRHRDELIDCIDPEYIAGLEPGMYRVKITVLDELFNNFTTNMEDYLIDKTQINYKFNANLNKDMGIKPIMPLENLISAKKNQDLIVKTNIMDVVINPNLILRQSILADTHCPKCNSNLDFFLRQLKPGCGYCFFYFLPYIQEYADSIKKSLMKKEEEVEQGNQLEKLNKMKDEAVKNKNWELAAKIRDQIKELNKYKFEDD